MFDINLTKHLAELGKLTFTEEELEKVTAEMDDIIRLMDKVREFDENENTYVQSNVFYQELRKDIPESSTETDKILANSKKVRGNSFEVPKVV